MITNQNIFMKYDPATGKQGPSPRKADDYRKYHGGVAWLYNPWNGSERDPRDIGSDVFGYLIVPDGEPTGIASVLTELKVTGYSKENYSYPFPDEITVSLMDEAAEYVKKGLPETQSVNIDDLCIYCDKPKLQDDAGYLNKKRVQEDTGLYLHFITQDDGIRECEKGNYSGNDYD